MLEISIAQRRDLRAQAHGLNPVVTISQNGLTDAELVEAIVHLAFYAGWPRAMSAVHVAKRVFAEPAD